MARIERNCESCKNAIYDWVDWQGYGSRYISSCCKEDDMTEEEMEKNGIEVECPFWESSYIEGEDEYMERLMEG